MLEVILEMETSDPDDFMTLLWFADHPDALLIGVVLTPGTREQVQLARWGLIECGRSDVPIGAFNLEHTKQCVSAWHWKVYGDAAKSVSSDAEPGPDLIARLLAAHPRATLLTGAPPKNSGAAHERNPNLHLERWVCQGGFAGDSIVPKEDRLAKFDGKETCQTFNLGGASKEALALLQSPRIDRRLFVSKNVCHGVAWDLELSATLAASATRRKGHEMIRVGMDAYLAENPLGKLVHDLLAAATAMNESVCTFTEVELYRVRGEWGSRARSGTNTWISRRYDRAAFVATLAR